MLKPAISTLDFRLSTFGRPKVVFLALPKPSHAMKMIVGLGNPGIAYRRTRHNLGFMVVQKLAEQRGMRFRRAPHRSSQAQGRIGKEQVVLVRPMTFMNVSGLAVGGALRDHRASLEELLVVCDDVNLDLGRMRLRRSGTAGGHNGLKSLIEHLQSEAFPRLRLGVGPRPEGVDMMSYVLSPFRRGEWPRVHEVIARAVQAIETWVYHGIDEAMNRFN
jgi:PTH1 family peptidyl-tRNA hydrolase